MAGEIPPPVQGIPTPDVGQPAQRPEGGVAQPDQHTYSAAQVAANPERFGTRPQGNGGDARLYPDAETTSEPTYSAAQVAANPERFGSRRGQDSQRGTASLYQEERSQAEGLSEKPTNDSDVLQVQGERIAVAAGQQPSTEFTEALRQSLGRFERVQRAIAELPEADRQVLAKGAREHAKDAAGVDDTADLDPKARDFNEAYLNFLLGNGWDAKLK